MNEHEFNSEELAIIKSWKHFKKGDFFICKHLKKYSIFLDDSDGGQAFAVSGIFDPLEEMFPHPSPFLLKQFCPLLRTVLSMMDLSKHIPFI